MFNQDVKMLVNAEGFTKAIESKTIFFTNEGKKRLGIPTDQKSIKEMLPVAK